jgi:hypothetical protein
VITCPGGQETYYATDHVDVSSNGVTFMPSFVKIYHLVQSWSEDQTHRRHGYLISLLTFSFFLSFFLSFFEKVMWAINATSDNTNNFSDCLQYWREGGRRGASNSTVTGFVLCPRVSTPAETWTFSSPSPHHVHVWDSPSFTAGV